jgi:flagellar basal body L-ring protein FlgH
MWVQRTETGIHRINIQAIMGPDDRNTDKFTNLTQIARARIEYGGYIHPQKKQRNKQISTHWESVSYIVSFSGYARGEQT